MNEDDTFRRLRSITGIVDGFYKLYPDIKLIDHGSLTYTGHRYIREHGWHEDEFLKEYRFIYGAQDYH